VEKKISFIKHISVYGIVGALATGICKNVGLKYESFHFLRYLLHSGSSILQPYPLNGFNYVLVGYGGFLGSWSKREF